jgi:uncharacterized tellurite resistance protein B-like protein
MVQGPAARHPEVLMSILEMLGLKNKMADAGSDTARTKTVNKIAAELMDLPRAEAEYLAAFAYLLSRVAHADMDISEEERLAMQRIIVERGEISAGQAVIVVDIATNQALLFGGTENFLVTQEFNDIATEHQKVALLHCMYEVCGVDHSITAREDHEIRMISEELLLYHSDFIRVRQKYAANLEVLKKP